jgi:cytochrome c oxidase accessory protein FixG
MTKAFGPWRRLVGVLQGVVILGLPFLRVGGQSALRFDVPALRLYFFGTSIWIEEFFLVLIALLFATFLIIFFTLVLGRIWCGWVCPQTVLSDLTAFIRRKGNVAGKAAGHITLLFISALVGANLVWYFVSPYEFFPQLVSGGLHPVVWGTWMALAAVIYLDLAFIRQKFCATICPYARMQSVLYDRSTLVIAFDPARTDECRECRACVQVCPVDIDIREGLSPACINCAKCIDACKMRLEPRGLRSLVNYSFGLPGEAVRVVRQNAVAVGLVTAIFLGFLVYLSATNEPIEATLLRNMEFPSSYDRDGNPVNSFIISLRNFRDEPLDIHISLPGASVVPDMVEDVGPGEVRKATVYVTLEGQAEGGGRIREIEFILAPEGDLQYIKRQARFIMPARGG